MSNARTHVVNGASHRGGEAPAWQRATTVGGSVRSRLRLRATRKARGGYNGNASLALQTDLKNCADGRIRSSSVATAISQMTLKVRVVRWANARDRSSPN